MCQYLIFVVDDEPILAHLARMRLLEAGFSSVEVFCDPLSALQRIKEGARPAVVITDFCMPGMNGCSLIKTIRTVCPTIKALILSAAPEVCADSEFPVLAKTVELYRNLPAIIEHKDKANHLLCQITEGENSCPAYANSNCNQFTLQQKERWNS